MPLPLAPVAAVALRYGTVALAAYALSRSVHTAAVRQADEDALDTVADAMELDALSEELDSAMVGYLGATTDALTARAYGEAYREIGRRADRARQIDLIDHLGRSLNGLTRQKFIGSALRMMRKPAEVAGLGALQAFLERGYAAFRTMGGASEFVDIVVGRERAISNALFAGDDSVLD